MKRMTSLVAAALMLAAWGVAFAQEEGWVELFNGKDLTGWEQKNGKAIYEVKDGVIAGTCVPKTENSFLCTEKHYTDFVLEFEFKDHPSLNSGVQIRSNSLADYKDGRVHGYQCELEDENNPRGWWCGIYDEGRRGWLFPTKEDEAAGKEFGAKGEQIWKNGEWNKVRIEAKGNRIQTWLNGEPRADLTDDMTPGGFIALQVHSVGDKTDARTVCWRNIRIKELK